MVDTGNHSLKARVAPLPAAQHCQPAGRRGARPAQAILLLATMALAPLQAATSTLPTFQLPPLPLPVSNNAVAALEVAGGIQLFSFLGMGAGKRPADIMTRAFTLEPGAHQWVSLPPVPGDRGYLAASAVAIHGSVYLMGGYTVAANGVEHTLANLLRFDPASHRYTRLEPIPVAVDDAVALSYQDRYIYLVSGWHDTGNVNLIQLFDSSSGKWTQATPKPGHALFGHSGAIEGTTMLLVDGVVLEYTLAGERRFSMSDEVYLGNIDADDPARIEWHRLPPHPGPPRYRMAAAARLNAAGTTRFVFAGGSDNPYNFNGIGYDGAPSSPRTSVLVLDLASRQWHVPGQLASPGMDFRALLRVKRGFVTLGGMLAAQKTTATVSGFALPEEP